MDLSEADKPSLPHIRNFAANRSSDIVLAAEFEDVVHVWSLSQRKRLTTILARTGFGGKRLALSKDEKTLFCAAYHNYGVSAYRISDGTLLWNRRDLKKCQVLDVFENGTSLWCGFYKGQLRELDCETGATLRELRGVRELYESPFENTFALEYKRHLELICDGREKIKIPFHGWAMLAVAFAPGVVIVSGAGGPTRCLSTHTGSEIWRHEEDESHALKLCFCEEDQTVHLIWYSYKNGGDSTLISLDVATGKGRTRFLISNAWEWTFCRNGRYLVTSSGQCMDTRTGQTEFIFPLPPYDS